MVQDLGTQSTEKHGSTFPTYRDRRIKYFILKLILILPYYGFKNKIMRIYIKKEPLKNFLLERDFFGLCQTLKDFFLLCLYHLAWFLHISLIILVGHRNHSWKNELYPTTSYALYFKILTLTPLPFLSHALFYDSLWNPCEERLFQDLLSNK